jgi:hypothetical protein
VNIESMIKEFRRPFSPDDVNYKIQTVGQKACLCVAYVDARHVQERLNKVTGGKWSNTNREIFGPNTDNRMELLAVEATISINLTYENPLEQDIHISHSDVGSLDNVNENAHGLKAVYSDAFKRAAVHFGIAQSLYTLPTMFLTKGTDEVKEYNGKPNGITKKGHEILKAKYLAAMPNIIKQFGEIYD